MQYIVRRGNYKYNKSHSTVQPFSNIAKPIGHRNIILSLKIQSNIFSFGLNIFLHSLNYSLMRRNSEIRFPLLQEITTAENFIKMLLYAPTKYPLLQQKAPKEKILPNDFSFFKTIDVY